MSRDLFVVGMPGLVGGASTELLHNLTLWLSRGVRVRFVADPRDGMTDVVRALGAEVHPYRPGMLKGQVVASWCNARFLEKLPRIFADGRPRCVLWANCMTWTFRDELLAHGAGMIDRFLFVSDYQRRILAPKLAAAGAVRELEGYRPYFDPTHPLQPLPFRPEGPDGYFGVGRLSRADPSKFHSETWRMFDRVLSPGPKKVFVLGWDERVHERTGHPPASLDWMTWGPGAIPSTDLYSRVHALMHYTGGSRESYGRTAIEAMASGVAVLVEDDYAYPELVEQGVTGWRCKSPDEMSFRASELAFDSERRVRMVHAARERLVDDIANADRCWAPWAEVLS